VQLSGDGGEGYEGSEAAMDCQIRREDVLRKLGELAFGGAGDAVKLAFLRGEAARWEDLDLSAVAEVKVSERGVEIKLVDRVRALETLWNLLGNGDCEGLRELYRAMEESADTFS